MASLRSALLVAVISALPLQAQTTFTDFSYSYSSAPNESYPDSGNELNDGIASVPSWGNADWTGGPGSTEPFAGWLLQSFSIRFEFSSAIEVQTASFYFADSQGAAGVYFPFQLRLRNDSAWVDRTEHFFGFMDDTMMAVPFTFDVANVTTDHLILDVQPWGQWTMMTEATFTASAIPEPSTYAAIAGAAMLGFAIWRRRRAMT